MTTTAVSFCNTANLNCINIQSIFSSTVQNGCIVAIITKRVQIAEGIANGRAYVCLAKF